MNEDQIIKKLDIQKHGFRVVIGRTKIDYDKTKNMKTEKNTAIRLKALFISLKKA